MADQFEPSHRATLLTAVPPALVKRPAATRSLFGSVVSAYTCGNVPDMPVPSADQAVPSQRAMLLTVTPPAVAKAPPAIRSPLGMIVMASTTPLTPAPTGNQ